MFWRWEMSPHALERMSRAHFENFGLSLLYLLQSYQPSTNSYTRTRRSMSLACRSTMCHNSSILKTPKQMSFLSVSGGRKRQGLYIGQKGKNTGEQHVVARPLLFITSSFFPLYPYNSIFYLLPKQLLLTSD